MADLIVNDDAIYGMTRALTTSALALTSLVPVPWCNDVLASAAWRRLTLRAGTVVSGIVDDLQALSSSAATAVASYAATDQSLAAGAGSAPVTPRPGKP